MYSIFRIPLSVTGSSSLNVNLFWGPAAWPGVKVAGIDTRDEVFLAHRACVVEAESIATAVRILQPYGEQLKGLYLRINSGKLFHGILRLCRIPASRTIQAASLLSAASFSSAFATTKPDTKTEKLSIAELQDLLTLNKRDATLLFRFLELEGPVGTMLDAMEEILSSVKAQLSKERVAGLETQKLGGTLSISLDSEYSND